MPLLAAPALSAKKKSKQPSEQQNPEVVVQRTDFSKRAALWVAKHLKWLDEMGSQLNLTRNYARALPGERVIEGVPSDYGKNYTLVGVIGLKGFEAPWLIEGALNGEAFKLYISKVLGPTLNEGDIVIMDNLPTHKVTGIAAMIEERGARLEYLPPYSPDMNPIERCWSKIKTYLRKAKARSYRALVRAIKEALDTITESDIRAWFEFCGYAVH